VRHTATNAIGTIETFVSHQQTVPTYRSTFKSKISSGGACFPPRWCELLVGRPYRDMRVGHFRPVPYP